MKKLIILLTLALSISFADAAKYPALKVKDYKNLNIVIDSLPKSNCGLTIKDIETEIKLLFIQNGIKPKIGTGNHLYIAIGILELEKSDGDVFDVKIEYIRSGAEHPFLDDPISFQDKILPHTGWKWKPQQGDYNSLGISHRKSFILDALKSNLKKFLVDYIESNIE